MKRLLLLVFLCAPLLAAEGDLYVVERIDAGGSSVTVVRETMNRGTHGFTKLGAMALTPGASYAVAPSAGTPTVEAHLFQSVANGMSQSAQAFHFVAGKLPQPVYQYQGVVPVALAAYSFDEVVAYDALKGAFVILRPNGFEYASADNLLKASNPIHDVTLARISKDEILVMYHEGPTPPRVGFPADYTLSRVQFYALGSAAVITSYQGLKKVVGTSTFLSPGGAFYVAADMYGQFLAHQEILAVGNQSPHLKRLSSPHGSTMVPLSHGRNQDVEMLEVQMGDALWLFNARAQNATVLAPAFFSSSVGSVTVRGNSQGPAHHRVLSVTPTLRSDDFPYLQTVAAPMTQAAATAKAAVNSLKKQVEARFGEMWKDIYKAAPGVEVGTADLAMLLNVHPGASEWLYDLLVALTEDERTALGIAKRGYNFHAIATGGRLKLDLLYDKVSALANCGAVLAKKP